MRADMEEQLQIKEAAKKQALIDELEHAVRHPALPQRLFALPLHYGGAARRAHRSAAPNATLRWGWGLARDRGVVPPVSLDTATAGVVNPLSARWQAALQQHVQLTQYVEADHKAARREYLKHLMEQNKKVPAPQLSDFCVWVVLLWVGLGCGVDDCGRIAGFCRVRGCCRPS